MSEIPDDIMRAALNCLPVGSAYDHDLAISIAKALSDERQRNAEIMEEVRKVLGCFAEAAASYDPDEGDGDQIAWAHDFKIGSLRSARALLSKLGEL